MSEYPLRTGPESPAPSSFNDGDYLSLHESELRPYDYGRALAEATNQAIPNEIENPELQPSRELLSLGQEIIAFRNEVLGDEVDA